MIAETNTKKWFADLVVEDAKSQIKAWYQSYSESILDVARAFPAEHVKAFEKRFPQYNLTEIFGLNPKSGLSNFLSCYPKDPKYLKPLKLDGQGRPARSKDGSMTPALRLLLLSNLNRPIAPVSMIPVRIDPPG